MDELWVLKECGGLGGLWDFGLCLLRVLAIHRDETPTERKSMLFIWLMYKQWIVALLGPCQLALAMEG